jgi:plastocyanin
MKLSAAALFAAAAFSVAGFATTASAQITGKVMLEGEPPQPQEVNMGADPKCAALHAHPIMDESIVAGDKGELANVVVSIKAPEGKPLKGEVPKKPVTVNQKGCQYSPHVVAMMVGQDLVFTNSDTFLHNVHSLAFDNKQFNISQPNKDEKGVNRGPDVKTPERFAVKCDIHPWMLVQVNAFEHPFFAVSNEKGEFSIPTKGLPDGKYELEIWQEKLLAETPMTAEVEVKDGKAKVPDIKVPAAEKKADAGKGDSDLKLASAKTKSGACCNVKSKAQAIASAAQGK